MPSTKTRAFVIMSAATILCLHFVPCVGAPTSEEFESVSSDGTTPEAVQGKDLTAIKASEGSGDPLEKLEPESLEDAWKLLELETLDAPEGIESIIGRDDRVRVRNTTVYPYRAVVLITSDQGRCTGWLVGPDLVMTAGHCVHSGSGGSWSTNVQVFPGRDGATSPYGSCGAKRLYSIRGWVQNGDEKWDYGAIKLNCKIGDRVGWLGTFWQTSTLDGYAVELPGYPGDKPLQQWTNSDQVNTSQKSQIFYKADTVGGNSGGGVLYNHPEYGMSGAGTHAYGLHGSGPHRSSNHGTRMTKELFEVLLRWRNAD